MRISNLREPLFVVKLDCLICPEAVVPRCYRKAPVQKSACHFQRVICVSFSAFNALFSASRKFIFSFKLSTSFSSNFVRSGFVSECMTSKHLFWGDFLDLILLGFLKLNIVGMAPGFRVFRPIPKLTRISSALKWCSQTKYFWIHHKDWSCHLLLFSDTLKLYLSIFSFPCYLSET